MAEESSKKNEFIVRIDDSRFKKYADLTEVKKEFDSMDRVTLKAVYKQLDEMAVKAFTEGDGTGYVMLCRVRKEVCDQIYSRKKMRAELVKTHSDTVRNIVISVVAILGLGLAVEDDIGQHPSVMRSTRKWIDHVMK